MALSAETTAAIAQALNGHFDVNEVTGILAALNEINGAPRVASTSAVGAVLKMTDPGTVPSNSTLAFVITYLNTLRDIFVAAGMLEPGQGGGS